MGHTVRSYCSGSRLAILFTSDYKFCNIPSTQAPFLQSCSPHKIEYQYSGLGQVNWCLLYQKCALGLSFNHFNRFDTPYLHPRTLNISPFLSFIIWYTASAANVPPNCLELPWDRKEAILAGHFGWLLTHPNHMTELPCGKNYLPITGRSQVLLS